MDEILDLGQLDELLVGADPVTVTLSEPSYNLILCLLSVADEAHRWGMYGDELDDSEWADALGVLSQAVEEVMDGD